MYFVYLLLNYWDFEKLNLKLSNLVFFKNKQIFSKGVRNICCRYGIQNRKQALINIDQFQTSSKYHEKKKAVHTTRRFLRQMYSTIVEVHLEDIRSSR